jgi:hypothetical protein
VLAFRTVTYCTENEETPYQKGKNAGTAAAMSAYKQLEAQERQ